MASPLLKGAGLWGRRSGGERTLISAPGCKSDKDASSVKLVAQNSVSIVDRLSIN